MFHMWSVCYLFTSKTGKALHINKHP